MPKEDSCEEIITITLGKEKFNLKIKIPVKFPSSYIHTELAYRLIKFHNIPICFEEELKEKLKILIHKKNDEYYRNKSKKYIEDFKNGSISIKDIASYWKPKYTVKPNEEEIIKDDISTVYHSVVHSPAAHSLLQFEHFCANAVSSLVDEKDIAIEKLKIIQTVEMQEVVSNVGYIKTDADVNDLAVRQLEDLEILEVEWDSTILALKEQHKKEFRGLVHRAHEGQVLSSLVLQYDDKDSECKDLQCPIQEESFTIHLGMQMKQMHNLRLMSADVIDLLKYRQQNESSINVPPQRIQTSMSLYSSNLNGLVLLVDDRISTYSGIRKEFGRVSSRSAEFHFPELDDQLEAIRNLVPKVTKWRSDHPTQIETEQETPQNIPQNLKPGDFYITKHSNLMATHVLFHVIIDDKLTGEVNSRHSVILALRNVLKAACLGDVTTLTVPLLLTHKLSEEMTISWCQRRAELVYKCIKGFMIEMASWGGTEMKTLQFLVPKGISDDLFQSLAAMLQSIFRVSNPLVVKSS